MAYRGPLPLDDGSQSVPHKKVFGLIASLPVLFGIKMIGTRYRYSSTSLVRGFWDEIFWPSKPRTTEEPRTGEGHRKVDIWRNF